MMIIMTPLQLCSEAKSTQSTSIGSISLKQYWNAFQYVKSKQLRVSVWFKKTDHVMTTLI